MYVFSTYNDLCVCVATLVFALLSAIYYYCTSTFGVWKRLKVPYVRPIPLFGNYLKLALGIDHVVETYDAIYKQLAGEKYGGMFQMRTPYLMVRDPELINIILKKDYSCFRDRGIYEDFEVNPLTNNLFFMVGPKWKVIRNKLSPVFTSGKLKHMYAEVTGCVREMMDNIGGQLTRGNPMAIQVREIMGKFTTDVIGTCIFGLKLNAVSNDDSPFRRYGITLFRPSARYFFREILVMVSPKLLKIVKLGTFPLDASKFFYSVIFDVFAYREKNAIIRDDFVHTLMQARKDLVFNDDLPENEKFSESQIAANAFVMFAAGIETTSTALAFCLYELSLNKHVQNRTREEIKLQISKFKGEINNELMNDLEYLDMVIAETLRKYPATFGLFREASTNYQLPNDSLVIEKNQKILIPIYSLHYDPEYFKDPDVFDPQRFSPEEKAKRPNGVYLPFGEGPRMCIGKRFAELQMKSVLVNVLSKFEVEPCEKTEIPIKFSKSSILIIPKHEAVWLNFKPLSD